MKAEQIRAVRRFNRMATRRAGALEERFLGRDRPLGESRVLFEIGREGASLRDLRARLGLDSGYLSRLVQRLETVGLIEVRAGDDARVRRAELTPAGVLELDEIDRRSDEIAASVLRPLSAVQRERLVMAMEEVHRLLTRAALEVAETPPDAPEARFCLERYYADLDQLFPEGFELGRSLVPDAGELAPPSGAFLVAAIEGRPVACGGVKRMSGGVGYVKRMWVDPTLRGLGLGRRMLEELEAAASRLGCTSVQLETNRALEAAIAMYRSSGYQEVEPFNDEPYAHHWFRKRLAP